MCPGRRSCTNPSTAVDSLLKLSHDSRASRPAFFLHTYSSQWAGTTHHACTPATSWGHQQPRKNRTHGHPTGPHPTNTQCPSAPVRSVRPKKKAKRAPPNKVAHFSWLRSSNNHQHQHQRWPFSSLCPAFRPSSSFCSNFKLLARCFESGTACQNIYGLLTLSPFSFGRVFLFEFICTYSFVFWSFFAWFFLSSLSISPQNSSTPRSQLSRLVRTAPLSISQLLLFP